MQSLINRINNRFPSFQNERKVHASQQLHDFLTSFYLPFLFRLASRARRGIDEFVSHQDLNVRGRGDAKGVRSRMVSVPHRDVAASSAGGHVMERYGV